MILGSCRPPVQPAIVFSQFHRKLRDNSYHAERTRPYVDINEIRKRIDLLDDVLLRIFNERARLALEIGHLKKELNLPVFDPSREKRIFARMKEDNPGPLDDEAIVRMFERVVDESRRLERITSHKEED
jgi:chorismate mutase